ncbi:putative gustatory receptor 98b isoform X1 [Drosophila mojavensis]|uniref:putative gustatory receptor 98b isoform X1 n=1 Tax=Drosophila mojavensis TaxID=7230 RepID=UPI001CD09BF0|nr:putative gustatory receptor 98b isoform X1 [Drosophila mojavensis]
MEGNMLTAARPYLQLLALLTLTPPPSFYEGALRGCDWRLWMLGFGCYCFCILLLGIDVTYVNIRILNFQILMLEVEDFTSAQGKVQKLCYPLLLIVIHGNMLIYFRKLGSIYTEIAALERDIDAASQSLGGLGRRLKFRQRLAKLIGLWLLILSVAFPLVSVPSMTEYMDWYYKIFTELLLVMFQMKIVEYGLFVLFVEELLLRLRHTLIQLQQEFTNCEHHALLQALCVALQRNKQLVARVWKLVGELEIYYTLPMMSLFVNNGFAMLHIVNWAYIQTLNPNDCTNCRFTRFGNVLILLLNLLIPCWLSQRCINTVSCTPVELNTSIMIYRYSFVLLQYASINRIIHNVRCGAGNSNPEWLSNILREYVLQMEHLKLRFSCRNFFDINLKSFGGVS